jgi:hypothetical protein
MRVGTFGDFEVLGSQYKDEAAALVSSLADWT